MDQVMLNRVLASLIVLIVLSLVKSLICSLLRRKITDPARYYHWRRMVVYTYSLLAVLMVGRVWVEDIDSEVII